MYENCKNFFHRSGYVFFLAYYIMLLYLCSHMCVCGIELKEIGRRKRRANSDKKRSEKNMF